MPQSSESSQTQAGLQSGNSGYNATDRTYYQRLSQNGLINNETAHMLWRGQALPSNVVNTIQSGMNHAPTGCIRLGGDIGEKPLLKLGLLVIAKALIELKIHQDAEGEVNGLMVSSNMNENIMNENIFLEVRRLAQGSSALVYNHIWSWRFHRMIGGQLEPDFFHGKFYFQDSSVR